MSEMLLQNEGLLRMSFFLGVFLIMGVCEVLSPRRRREIPRLFRWSNNLGIVVLDSVVVKLCFPLLALGMAVIAGDRSWGLFNLIELPLWIAFVVSIILLDMAIYFQHVLFHRVPMLWRLHRAHHTDLEFDVTTGIRFHPIEIVMSMGIKLILVFVLGPPVIAVLIFEILLNASAMFNHSNFYIPVSLDRVLRRLIVTPDMHRVHHSVLQKETNSNYGFFLPWWDRLFGTYCDQPQEGHEGMQIGIEAYRKREDMRLDQLLVQPFREPGEQTRGAT
jgi:sterol desaturase/sphingolipid hydroxylase (fatty acid hydroxylase superfamily)